MNNGNSNPYGELLGIIGRVSRENNSPSLQIGRVISPPPEIAISHNGIVLKKEDLWISHYLLTGYPRTARGHLVSATQYRGGGGGDSAYESHNHDIDNDYTDTIFTTDTLKVGEFVFLMPFFFNGDRQQFAVLDQAIKL